MISKNLIIILFIFTTLLMTIYLCLLIKRCITTVKISSTKANVGLLAGGGLLTFYLYLFFSLCCIGKITSTPTAKDVYQGKTVLEVTDNDSIVKYKDEIIIKNYINYGSN